MANIERANNVIKISGNLHDFHYLLAKVHNCIEKFGYQDVVLDMSTCTSAFQNPMLSVCAQVMSYRARGIEFSLNPPNNPKLFNLFNNANWSYLIDPDHFSPSTFRGHTQIPATQYKDPQEQQASVNKIVNVILGALPNLERSDLAAFEWAINEITDNVLVHSESDVGGLVQVSTFKRNKRSVQFIVADAGIGIPSSLKRGLGVMTDTDALDKAIREGVTRDTKVGQGNGLFGCYRVCSQSNGHFRIDSGHAKLEYEPRSGSLTIRRQNTPYSGTMVAATIVFDDPQLLQNALQFNDIPHTPVDYVESRYEQDSSRPAMFILSEECVSFGSRVSGKPVRQKILNIVRMLDPDPIEIDFSGIAVVSSSFADEVFGKLFLQLGPMKFMQNVRLINTMETVDSLINKAIAQRMLTGISDVDVE